MSNALIFSYEEFFMKVGKKERKEQKEREREREREREKINKERRNHSLCSI